MASMCLAQSKRIENDPVFEPKTCILKQKGFQLLVRGVAAREAMDGGVSIVSAGLSGASVPSSSVMRLRALSSSLKT